MSFYNSFHLFERKKISRAEIQILWGKRKKKINKFPYGLIVKSVFFRDYPQGNRGGNSLFCSSLDN